MSAADDRQAEERFREACADAKRVSLARATIVQAVAGLPADRVASMLLELYVEAMEPPAARPARVPGAAPREPAPGSLRATVLAVLRGAARPLRNAAISKAVADARPGTTPTAVGSALWEFVRDGMVFKRRQRGRMYYATDASTFDA